MTIYVYYCRKIMKLPSLSKIEYLMHWVYTRGGQTAAREPHAAL